ncbi:uncharacterized protein BCR38DRAFT_439126 [Pseudomassariella vexata]|uniref:Uncharacterized protein n=1 Tax=Pseudomassariella vexata TaxID=1141098 RepID=A0A1Y2DTH4_9PEZI|nr:uncharacterized protein BCR38DRAFT_439126 [Pseudomassariella vexata]ORY62582.1 hypothetical protein BCR38DRAFT_439126 [Pseudomassariella vexata]
MSPAKTRNRARLEGNGSAVQLTNKPDIDVSSSSDDNDEGIPNKPTPKKTINTLGRPSLRRAAGSGQSKRPNEDRSTPHLLDSKRRRADDGRTAFNIPTSRFIASDKSGYPSPASAHLVPSIEGIEARTRISASAEDDVPPELLNRVNASILRRRDVPESPSRQLLRDQHADVEHQGQGISDFEIDADVKADPIQELELGDEYSSIAPAQPQMAALEDTENALERSDGSAAGNDSSTSKPQLDHELSSVLERSIDSMNGLGGQIGALGSQASSAQDRWEAPEQPQRDPLPTLVKTSALLRRSRLGQESNSATADQEYYNETEQDREMQPPEWREDHAIAVQTIEAEDENQIVISIVEVDEQPDIVNEDHAGPQDASNPPNEAYVDSDVTFDVTDTDDDNDSATRRSGDGANAAGVRAIFALDVQNLRARPIKYDEDSVFFDAPPASESTIIPLSSTEFKAVHKFMKRRGWTGYQRNWEAEILRRDPSTTGGKVLLRYLLKFERLVRMTPKALRIAEQNRFLNEHSDLLRFYFYQIDANIDRIRSRLPSFTTESEIAEAKLKKRKAMARDLIKVIIPMLVRVLGRAWNLGDAAEVGSSFSSSTIQLLARVVGWLQKLYKSCACESEKWQLEKKPETQYALVQWQKDIRSREQLGPLLNELHAVLSQAPDDLLREEQRIQDKEERHLRSLARQEQLKINWKRQEEARQRGIEEQNQNVARSIRGRPPLPRRTPAPSSQTSSPMPQYQPVGWRKEEEDFLWKMMRDTLLDMKLPHLARIAMMISHTEGETIEKAQEILETVARHGCGESTTDSAIQSFVQQLMSQWKK